MGHHPTDGTLEVRPGLRGKALGEEDLPLVGKVEGRIEEVHRQGEGGEDHGHSGGAQYDHAEEPEARPWG